MSCSLTKRTAIFAILFSTIALTHSASFSLSDLFSIIWPCAALESMAAWKLFRTEALNRRSQRDRSPFRKSSTIIRKAARAPCRKFFSSKLESSSRIFSRPPASELGAARGVGSAVGGAGSALPEGGCAKDSSLSLSSFCEGRVAKGLGRLGSSPFFCPSNDHNRAKITTAMIAYIRMSVSMLLLLDQGHVAVKSQAW